MSTITIYHNSRCSKSRAAIDYLETHAPDAAVTVVNYLDTPPTATELKEIFRQAGVSAHEAIRSGESVYKELALSESMAEDELIEKMVANPILIERPIVVTEKGAVIARPTEKIAEVL
ncbi:MAG: arsenate reductase (glutaredoxin) [Corynebacterium sp.]|uniref:arsenate reductase (glutaredoxin) n=1 Tax=Corynebacterium sp. TaxID=1720 RepID=UPI0026DCC3B0|nr:arsenate reductase (glutaredoxin) [Corynebacterium sp.]MDO5097127.1 arsenate reductase (glutaredoxin) [Corynebacterium sp.]